MDENETLNHAPLIHVKNKHGLIVRSASLARRGLESLQTLHRVVRFPSDVSIGDVYLFDPSSDISSWFIYLTKYQWDGPFTDFEVEEIKGVCGEISVHSGKNLILVVNADDKSAFSRLEELDPQALDGLLITGSIAYGECESFKHLSRLRFLSLSRDGVTDAEMQYLADLGSLFYLDLKSSDLTDKGLSLLSSLTELRYLYLSGTKISDNGLSQVEKFPMIEYLNLDFTGITNVGLSNLIGATSLTQLSLWNTDITDEGLSHLSDLPNLEALDLSSLKITDSGLAYLVNLKSLSRLNLCVTRITDVGLSYLNNLPALSDLNLSGTNCTDEGLRYLAKSNFDNLSNLDLCGTKVTPMGLRYLYPVKSLRHVNVNLHGFSSKDLDEFRLCRPDCKITWDGMYSALGLFVPSYGRFDSSIEFKRKLWV